MAHNIFGGVKVRDRTHDGGNMTIFSTEVGDKIIQLIRAGNYIETAAAVTGVNKDTLHGWLAKAKEGKEPFTKFAQDIMKAVAEAEHIDVLNILKASKADWKASAWRLERKCPDRWGNRGHSTVTHQGAIDTSAKPRDYSKLSVEELETLEKLLTKAARTDE